MSNLRITKTGDRSAEITVTVCRINDFITAGRTDKVVIPVQDSDALRLLSANLSHLKANKFNGTVRIGFPGHRKLTMDQSIWRDLADALFGFALCMDLAEIGV